MTADLLAFRQKLEKLIEITARPPLPLEPGETSHQFTASERTILNHAYRRVLESFDKAVGQRDDTQRAATSGEQDQSSMKTSTSP